MINIICTYGMCDICEISSIPVYEREQNIWLRLDSGHMDMSSNFGAVNSNLLVLNLV